jgi:hypothetical protein
VLLLTGDDVSQPLQGATIDLTDTPEGGAAGGHQAAGSPERDMSCTALRAREMHAETTP